MNICRNCENTESCFKCAPNKSLECSLCGSNVTSKESFSYGGNIYCSVDCIQEYKSTKIVEKQKPTKRGRNNNVSYGGQSAY